MGKAQSKRSVDITIEGKKGGSEEIEVTGKLEKIEDLDQKQQVNGDATPQEADDNEKKNVDESENDKDLTTEKSSDNAQTNGDNEDQNTAVAIAVESSKEDDKESAPTKEGAIGAGEEISPLVDDSMKKSKKEKVKKKWSFRSISFGKKDKQKPTKTEETNGEPEKGAGDGVTETSKPEEDATDDTETKTSTEKLENGDAIESKLNGQKTPTPTDEKPTETVNEEKNATTEAPPAPASEPAAASAATNDVNTLNSNETTAMDTQNEPKENNVVSAEVIEQSEPVANNCAEPVKNGTVDTPVEENTDKMESQMVIALTVDNCKATNDQRSDEEKAHQNGVTVEEEEEPLAEKIKSQIEVMINIDNNPAAILESSSTSTTFSDHPIAQNSNSDITNISDEKASKVATVGCATIGAIENFVKPIEAPCNDTEIPKQTLSSSNIAEAQSAANSVANEIADLTFSEQNESHSNMPSSPIPEVALNNNDKCTSSNDIVTEEPLCETVVIENDPCETKTPSQNEPPPLPVSPPPSQVSVFAFKDNEDMGKVNDDNELLPVVQQQFAGPSTETDEFCANFDSIEIPNTNNSNGSVTEDKNETEITNTEQKDDDFVNKVTVIASGQEDNLITEENIRVVNAIVDDITEKAVEIVNEKQDKQQQHDDEHPASEIKPEAIIIENVSEIVQCYSTLEVTPSTVTTDTVIVSVENSNEDDGKGDNKISITVLESICVGQNEQNVDMADVTRAQSESKEQPESKELFSAFLNNDEYVSASKDVATAKENTTAELTTQDLPVTCE